MTVLERFESHYVPEPNTGCWLWTASLVNGGYGRVSVDGRLHVAHRLAYELYVGPIPEGKHLDHLCRTRSCVNPAHLEPVTQREKQSAGLWLVRQKRKEDALSSRSRIDCGQCAEERIAVA